MNPENSAEDSNRIVAVKNWHVFLTLATWLFLSAASYATQKTQLDDLTRRVQQLEIERVSKPEFDMAVQDIKERLARIETAVDRRK